MNTKPIKVNDMSGKEDTAVRGLAEKMTYESRFTAVRRSDRRLSKTLDFKRTNGIQDRNNSVIVTLF
jgi:hypothetical protein